MSKPMVKTGKLCKSTYLQKRAELAGVTHLYDINSVNHGRTEFGTARKQE